MSKWIALALVLVSIGIGTSYVRAASRQQASGPATTSIDMRDTPVVILTGL
jgi:hypothetical protein